MASRQPKTSPGGMIPRSVQLPAEVDAKLVEMARAEERSMSFMIAKAVREFVARADEVAKKAKKGSTA